jgi:two-component system chemotaxis response regulator CheB
VDDSASVRQVLKEGLESDPAIEVTGTASDPFVAAARTEERKPDLRLRPPEGRASRRGKP